MIDVQPYLLVVKFFPAEVEAKEGLNEGFGYLKRDSEFDGQMESLPNNQILT